MIFLGLLWWYLDMVVISPDHRCLGFLSLAHGKIALPWPLEAVCCHITSLANEMWAEICHLQVEFFTTGLCFDTPSFPSISATNLYLHFYLFLSLSASLSHSFSCSYCLSLSHTHIHITCVSLYTSASFFIAHWSICRWPSKPASSKWQPWTPSLHDQISRKENLIARAWDRFSSLNHVARGTGSYGK